MNNTLKLGIFTIVGLIAIMVSIIAAGSFSFGKKHNVYVRFDNISGLMSKAKVKIAGVDIGIIKDISLDGTQAKVKLSLHKKFPIYKNAHASIVSMGIIGTKYIEITPGESSLGAIKDGDFISAAQEISLEKKLNSIVEKFDEAVNGGLVDNLSEAIRALMGILVNFESQNNHINSIIFNLSKISYKLDKLISEVDEGKGVAGTILKDDVMAKDLKETVASIRHISSTLEDKVGKIDLLKVNWDYTGRYDTRNSKFRNDVGLTISPNPHKFYYLGASNLGDTSTIMNEEEKKEINTIDVLLGLRKEQVEIYAGMMRTKAGVGVGYSFFDKVYSPAKKLYANLNIRNFSREKHGAEIDVGIRFGVTKWFFAGVAVEDIAYKSSVMPYIKISIDDEDIASILGIASVAVVATK
jgi:phospholipid/cholesterol/gamma-HCH transport system substrate-binding protein